MTLEEARAAFVEPIRDGQKTPYVLFWRPGTEFRGGKETVRDELTCLELIGSMMVPATIDKYAAKPGWKIVDFWLPDGEMFEVMRQHLNVLMGRAEKRVVELEAEKEALLKKLRDAEARQKK